MCVCKVKIILTIILLPILLLSGCIPAYGPLNENSETMVPILTVHSGGASIKTDAHFSSALTFSTYGWLAADGASSDSLLPEVAAELPEIIMDENIVLEYKENCTFNSITIYNEAHKRIRTDIVKTEDLKSLQPGSYYISIKVHCQGSYIESEKKYESSRYHCMFKLTVE